MRSIIKQERKIELALEGHQYNDLRRWKDASKELSKSIKGWNVQGEIEEDFYKVTTLFVPRAFKKTRLTSRQQINSNVWMVIINIEKQ